MRPGGWPTAAGAQPLETYDYYDRLRTWQQIVRPDELVVRRFERAGFVEGRSTRTSSTPWDRGSRRPAEQVETVNESLDAEAVELLRIVNIVRGWRPRG